MSYPTRRQSATSTQASLTAAANSYALGSAAVAGNLLVVVLAGDKNTGTLTVTDNIGTNGGANPWTIETSIPGASVSLYIARKVAVGGETTITATTSTASATGNTGYCEELADDGAGAWMVVAKVTPVYSDTARASAASGTTDTADYDGRALAVAVVDSQNTMTATPTFSGYTTVNTPVSPAGSGGGNAACYVGTADVAAGATTSTTFASNGGSDQMTCAILVVGRVETTAPIPAVDAGADESIALGAALPTRTATENLNGGPAVTSRAWTISSGPAGVGTTIGTAATLSGWTPSAAGTYVIQYAATNSNGTGTDTATITVVAPSRSLLEAWLGVDAIAVKTSTNVSGDQARVAFSTSSGMTSPVYSTSLVTPTAAGVSKHAVPASLAADTAHWYQVELGGVLIGAPQPFRTLPAPSGQQSFTFAFSSCRDHVDNLPSVNPTALADAVTRGIDFFLQCGDFHYRDISTNNQALFQAGYDELYTRSNIANLLKSTPTDYVWDDHDYGGDNSNGSTASRPAAQAVYRDRVPHPALPSATGGIYHTWRVGRVRFIVLDCRSFRSPNGNTDNSSKTMLGSEQKTWLQGLLNGADTPLTVIVSSVGWVGGADSAQDHWGNYSTERTEVGGWITANASKTRCVFLSGDAHMLAYDNGTNSVAGVPQYHAAALNQSTSTKGGPYSGGSRASTNAYGYVSVVDSGSQIAFTYSGYYDGGTLWQSHTTTVATVATVSAAATLGGAAGLTVGGTLVRAAAATLGGTATVQATASAARQASANLGGTGGLTVGATPARPGAAVLGGSGDLTATASRGQSIGATLGGTLGLSAIPGVSGAATLGGTAGLTVGARQTHAVAAQLGGAAGVSATAFTTQRIGATLGGVAGLAVDGRRAQPIATQLGGVATLLVGGTRVHPIAATLGGTAGLTVSGIRAAAAATTLGGTLGVIAAAAAAGGGQLNISVWGVDRGNGGRLVPLPHHVKLALSDIENAAGAISLEYPARGKNFALLDQYVSNTSDLEVEIWLGGKASTAWRGYLNQREGDDVAETAVARFTGALMPQRLAETLIEPQAANEKKEFVVTAATPGGLALTLLAQAQARGALTDITAGFTTTHDSNGTPWPEVVNGKWSPSKTTYLQVLQKLATLGLAEFELTAGKVWRMYVFGGRGQNRTVGRPVTFRRGRNLTEATRRAGSRDGGTTVFVDGSEGLFARVSNPTALAQRGRVVEVSASAGNIVEQGALNAAAQKLATRLNAGIDERSYGLTFGVGHPRPAVHFGVGDLVQAETAGVLRNERVAQIQIDVDAGGPSGSAVTGDLIADRAAALAARLNEQANGGVTVGTSTATPEPDTLAPAAPTGLVADSLAYQEDVTGDTYASVTLGWAEVTANVDGSAATDVEGYRIRYKPANIPFVDPNGNPLGNDDAWSVLTFTPRTPPHTFSGVAPDTDIDIQVAAFDNSGNQGPWSAPLIHHTAVDNTPPPAPSAPVVSDWFGTLQVQWNGLDLGGAEMLAAAVDFDHVEVHVSQANNFTPDATTLTARIFGAGTWNVTDLPIGVTHYARLVAVDKIGNASTPSAVGSAIPRGIQYPDMGPQAIDSAQMRNAAILTAHIGDAQIVDAKVNTLSVGKVTAGTLSAAVTLSGIIRTGTTGARSEIDSAGIRLYNAAGTATVNLNAATGAATITGEYRTGFTGTRMVFNAAGGQPDEIWFYPSSGSAYAVLSAHNHLGQVNQGAINMRGNSVRSDGYTGHVGAYPPEAYIKWGALQAESVSALSCAQSAATLWAPTVALEADARNANDGGVKRIEFRHRSSAGGIRGGSILQYHETPSGEASLHNPGANLSITWSFNSGIGVYIGNFAGAGAAITAADFKPASSRTTKKNIRAAAFPGQRQALDVVAAVESKSWNYDWEPTTAPRKRKTTVREQRRDRDGRPVEKDGVPVVDTIEVDLPDEAVVAPHVFPLAEELQAIAPDLVTTAPEVPGGLTVSLRDTVGVLWQALKELNAKVDTLSGPGKIAK